MSMHLQKCIGCPGSIKDLLTQKTKFKREHFKVLKRRNSESEDMISDDENNGAIFLLRECRNKDKNTVKSSLQKQFMHLIHPLVSSIMSIGGG